MIHTAPDIFKFKYVESDTQQIASDENSKLPEIQFSGRPLLGLRSDLRGRFVLRGRGKNACSRGGDRPQGCCGMAYRGPGRQRSKRRTRHFRTVQISGDSEYGWLQVRQTRGRMSQFVLFCFMEGMFLYPNTREKKGENNGCFFFHLQNQDI